jgi:hypothetical protein
MQCLAFIALAAVLITSLPGNTRAAARTQARTPVERVAQAKSADASSRTRRAANALRQFTGYVSAIDKSSLTVEKRGKKPESRVFTRHDEMSTTGEIEKDARVTVYYREEDGKAVAHRVVAKPARSGSSSRS